MTQQFSELWLLVRAGTQLCALPLEHVDETMRPQPLRPVPGVPPFVRGLAVIRGVPVPVVDAALALGHARPSPNGSRFVAIKAGARRVALAVDAVVGVRRIDDRHLSDVPPLLAGASEHLVSGIAALDSELLVILQSARLVPEAAWAAIEATGRR